MSTETELKLSLAPDDLRRLRRAPLLRRLKQGRGTTGTLKSVYFDTEDLQLLDSDLILRVRHIGRRRIQTLKTLGEPSAGLARRGEWETEIEGDLPLAQPLEDTGMDLPAPGDRLVRELQPIFTSEFKRTTYKLASDGWEVELALDDGQVVAPTGTTPIAEAELELKRGTPHILFDLARDLQREVDARVSVTSKAERGYALLNGTGLSPRRARPPVFSPDASIAQAFQSVTRTCIEQLLANQDVLFATRNPEAVHQMRVALRRLGSANRLFADLIETPETRALAEEIRWLQSALGPARDAEVFLSDILDPLEAELEDQPGFRALYADFSQRRADTFEAALAAVNDARFKQLALALGAWVECGDWQALDDPEQRARLDQPARGYAAAVLERLDRRVHRSLRHLEDLSTEERHRARIRVKRLRYAIEFFAGLFPDHKTKRMVSTLGRLQDCLGHVNDIAVAGRLLREHAERSGDAGRLWAAGQISGWHAGRVADLLASAEDGRRALDRLPRFWHDAN